MKDKIECYFCKEKLYKENYVNHLERKHNEELNNIIENFFQIYNSGFPTREIKEIIQMYRKQTLNKLSVIKENTSNYNAEESLKVNKWEPKDFNLEATTVWSFPNRGK